MTPKQILEFVMEEAFFGSQAQADVLIPLIKLAMDNEREMCARLCDDSTTTIDAAVAIRNRNNS